jgi:hypothetical protein
MLVRNRPKKLPEVQSFRHGSCWIQCGPLLNFRMCASDTPYR